MPSWRGAHLKNTRTLPLPLRANNVKYILQKGFKMTPSSWLHRLTLKWRFWLCFQRKFIRLLAEENAMRFS